MDLPFVTELYKSRAANGWHHGPPTNKPQGCRCHAALSYNVRRLRKRPVRTICYAAFHFAIHPVKAWSSTAHLIIRLPDSLCGLAEGLVDGIETCGSDFDADYEKEVHDSKLLDASTPLGDFVTVHGVVRNREHERRARCERLRWRLDNATDVRHFIKDAAEFFGLDGEDKSEVYDVDLLKEYIKSFRRACDQGDSQELLRILKTQIARDIGGIDNPRLFPERHFQTQLLIDQYIQAIDEVVGCIIQACAREDEQLDKTYVCKEVLQNARDLYGASALVLSGGGTLGMNHIGVVKTLLDTKAFPRIICGSSAGAIVCSVLGTHKDSELEEGLDRLCQGDLAVFVGPDERQGFLGRVRHFRANGHVFDPKNLERVMHGLYQDRTFREAYNRTGRVLNITVSSSSKYGKPRLLNYQSAPHVVISSAVVASCAVSFFYKPAFLVVKDENTRKLGPEPHSPAYADGSLDADIPIRELSAEFNVNLCIVSQTNPHVIPFLEEEHGIPHRFPVRMVRALNSSGSWARVHAMHLMDGLVKTGLWEYWGIKAQSIFGQKYTGDITILPVTNFQDFPRVLHNPTPEFMERATRNGERATWLKLNVIKHRLTIEGILIKAIHNVNELITFGPNESQRRRESLRDVPASQCRGRGRVRYRRSSSFTTSINSWPSRFSHGGLLSIKTKPSIPFDMLHSASNANIGVPSPSGSDSSPTLVSRGSDDNEAKRREESDTSPPPAEPVRFASAPNSPTTMPRNYFDSPSMVRLPVTYTSAARNQSPARARSPVPLTPALGASLTMTPSSPEQRYRQRFNTVSEPPTLSAASKYASREPTGPFGGEAQFPIYLSLPELRRYQRRFSAGVAELVIAL